MLKIDIFFYYIYFLNYKIIVIYYKYIKMNVNLWINRCDNIFIKFSDVCDEKININTIQLNEEIFGDKLNYKFIFLLKQYEHAYYVCYNKLKEQVKDNEEYNSILEKRKIKLCKIQNKIQEEINFINLSNKLVELIEKNNYDEFKKNFNTFKQKLKILKIKKRYCNMISYLFSKFNDLN